MQKGLFNYGIKDNLLRITNLEDRKVSTKIIVFGVSYQCLVDTTIDFLPLEERVLNFKSLPFIGVDLSNKMTIRIYENGKKVVDDYVSNHIEKAYVIISNDKYE